MYFPCYNCLNTGDEAPRCNSFMTCAKWREWAREQNITIDEKVESILSSGSQNDEGERAPEGVKNCPCCGGAADCNNTGIVDHEGNPLWWVECLECGLSTSGDKTKEEAEAKWNRRADCEVNAT